MPRFAPAPVHMCVGGASSLSTPIPSDSAGQERPGGNMSQPSRPLVQSPPFGLTFLLHLFFPSFCYAGILTPRRRPLSAGTVPQVFNVHLGDNTNPSRDGRLQQRDVLCHPPAPEIFLTTPSVPPLVAPTRRRQASGMVWRVKVNVLCTRRVTPLYTLCGSSVRLEHTACTTGRTALAITLLVLHSSSYSQGLQGEGSRTETLPGNETLPEPGVRPSFVPGSHRG